MDYRKEFVVKPDARVSLDRIDPLFSQIAYSNHEIGERIEKNRDRIADQQLRIYAERRHSVLIVLQGMDAAGKDSVVKHILSAMNPMSCTVTAFKVPTHEEAAHDFLWRHHKVTPGKGWVSIFNRSHYEAVLVERVHKLVPKKVWSKRYGMINAFEKLLHRNGTTVIKLFLHISKQEQLRRFKDRLDDPDKRWKISEDDYTERALWDDYTQAYEDALSKTSTARAPWYVVPSDRKLVRNFVVSEIIADALDELKISRPKPTVDLDAIRKKYHEAQES
ncbi:MAG: polyphosphate kinase 2 family protein [Hyphomicrobiales bacterium]|nr:polyphosphate kinase 2 family protein [Hyphomicrobiales bacterium]MBV9738747.1 polyphosphate kinase 2 family protein [Hyphomicrobiales bacterium]